MQVKFNTTLDDRGLCFDAVIQIDNAPDLDMTELRRYFTDISDSYSINTDGVDHTIYVSFHYNAKLCDIEEAINLVDEYIVEMA
jgi:hypothetical protein